MSAATEQQNNGDVAVEKVAADVVKDDLKAQKTAVEDSKPAAADNGTASKDEIHEDDVAPAKEYIKGIKRPFEVKNSESKKAKKEKPDADSDDEEEEILEEFNSSNESDEYDIPYDGEDDDIECEDDDDDENEDASDDEA